MLQRIIDKTDIIKKILCVVLISALCILFLLISFLITAIILTKTDFRYEALTIVTSCILAVNAILGGFIVSRWYKENGLFYGFLVAAVISVFVMILSLHNNTFNISAILLTKFCLIFLSGAAGGVIGVNTN